MPASFARCRSCGLCERRRTIVDGSGPLGSPLFVIGEAPGEREDFAGVPFVGTSGQLLRVTIYEHAGNMPVYLTNAVRCRPPDNRDPSPEELEACLPWLVEELQDVKPRVILCVGRIASQQARRALERLAWEDVEIFDAIHPAATLQGRSPDKRRMFTEQVREAVTRALGEKWARQVVVPDQWEVRHDIERIVFPPVRFLAMDTETDDLQDGIGHHRVGWSVSNGRVCGFTTDDPGEYLARVPHVYLHNAAYDLPQLGIDPWDVAAWDDTMLMAYVLRLWGEGRNLGLKTIGPRVTGISMDPIETIIGSGKQQIPFSEALKRDYAKASTYAAKDALVTSRLAEKLEQEFLRYPKLEKYYHEIEKPLVPIIIGMHQRGVLIDREKLEIIGKEIEEETKERSERLKENLGIENLRSPLQLPRALEQFGIELKGRTPTGRVQQDKNALLKAVGVDREEELDPDNLQHWIIAEILGIRQLEKLGGTYIVPIREGLDAEGAIHGQFNQAFTATNRLSSSNPNLQNIPARTPIGKRLRELFIARPGCALVRADYSQAELRIFADYTHDPLFLEAYPFNGPSKDLHQMVADRFVKWGVTRKAAKNGVFGAIYGAEEQKLAQTFGIPVQAAGEFLRDMREQAPALVKWRPYIHAQLIKNGYVETRLGWRNYYPHVFSPIRSEQQAAIREAANMPIQGTVAGIVKVLMVEGHKLAAVHGAHLLMQVHDEVVYEVPVRHVQRFMVKLGELGRRVPQRWIKHVPLELSVNHGANWREAA